LSARSLFNPNLSSGLSGVSYVSSLGSCPGRGGVLTEGDANAKVSAPASAPALVLAAQF
jgi:hypothetical protein